MHLFRVDPEKCNRDGICVETCPRRLIALTEDSEAVPVPTEDAEAYCINCGHCVAVCPTGAFALAKMEPEACAPMVKEWSIGPEQVEHFLRSRRSIRTFTDKIVDRKLIEKLIHIGAYAPSGNNSQPVRWRVIYDPKEVHRLAAITIDWTRNVIKEEPGSSEAKRLERLAIQWESGIEIICRGAPHVIVAHAPKNLRTAPAACTIALTYVELAAPAFGLGGCWGGYLNAAANSWPPMQATLDLPEGDVCYGAMMVGYPKYKYHRIPLRNEPAVSWR